jgi:hypothetical protein
LDQSQLETVLTQVMAIWPPDLPVFTTTTPINTATTTTAGASAVAVPTAVSEPSIDSIADGSILASAELSTEWINQKYSKLLINNL